MELKGKGWIIASLVLTIIASLILILAAPTSEFMLILIFSAVLDILLLSLCINGYSQGKKGWAIFAIIYGILTAIMNVYNGGIPIGGAILLIGGFVGYSTDG